MGEITLRKFLEDGSLWGSINTHENFNFIGIIGASELDLYTTINYGDKIVFKGFHGCDLDLISKFIVNNFSVKWNELMELESLAMEAGASEVKVRNETITEDTTKTEENNSLNKVASFNEDSLEVEGGVSNSATSGGGKVGSRETRDYTLNKETALEVLLSKSKATILRTVTKDVSNFLTLSVY